MSHDMPCDQTVAFCSLHFMGQNGVITCHASIYQSSGGMACTAADEAEDRHTGKLQVQDATDSIKLEEDEAAKCQTDKPGSCR